MPAHSELDGQALHNICQLLDRLRDRPFDAAQHLRYASDCSLSRFGGHLRWRGKISCQTGWGDKLVNDRHATDGILGRGIGWKIRGAGADPLAQESEVDLEWHLDLRHLLNGLTESKSAWIERFSRRIDLEGRLKSRP